METLMGISTMLLLSSFLGLSLLLVLVIFFYKMWWIPIRLTSILKSQGVKGPSYRLLYGNTKEISNMKEHLMGNVVDISHPVFPVIQPHFYLWFKIYGPNFLYWRGPRPELVVTDQHIIKELMSNREISMSKADLGSYIRKLVGDGLVTTKGKKWEKHRKLANHAFHSESLKSMVPAMIVSVEMMLEKWKKTETKEVEVLEEFKVLSFEIISRTAFGSSYLEGKQFFQMLTTLTALMVRNFNKITIPVFSKIWKNVDEVESDKLQKELRDLVLEIIRKRERMVPNGDKESYGTDFLGILLKANHDEDKNNRISIEDIIDECKTFYSAGHDTTSVLLSWTFLLLSIHTDWQEKARKEVLDIFGNHHPNFEGLSRLKTMSMIINETLRLYPPGSGIIRRVPREVRLGHLVIPSNVHVHVPTLALHHDTQIWGEDAHLFKPERFSNGVAKATKNYPAAFIPFGFGPRNCVGSDFANKEAKITLSMILQRYRFTLSPNYVHSPMQILMVRPQNGIQIVLHAL